MNQPLQSMTGFARVSGGEAGRGWRINLKSVNGKGLDVRLNLRPDLESLSGEIRRIIAAKLHRGNVTLSLSFEADASNGQVSQLKVNQKNLTHLLETVRTRAGQKIDPHTVATLLTIRGVVDPVGVFSQTLTEAERTALIGDINTALGSLVTARGTEGKALFTAMVGLLTEMARVLSEIKLRAKTHPETIRQTLMARLAAMALSSPISDEKIEHEIALLAVKADIQEEITRLDAHISDAFIKLEAGSPAGKSLEFLTQEMRREVNTICSKAQELKLTQAGLQMKSLIDQFKEQAANVE